MKGHIPAALVVALAVATSLALAPLSIAADPTLNLEGTGDLYSPSCSCSTTSCAGVFTANLSGTPFTKASLNLPLSTGLLPTAGKGGCARATGAGTLNSGAFSVQFYGQVCSDLPCMPTSRSPLPGATSEMLVSILGVAGKIPLLVP